MKELKVIKVAGQYVLKAPSAGWNSWYEIDGVRFKDSQDVVFQEPPEYAWKFTTNSKLTNYKKEDGSFLSIDEYKEQVANLTKDCACSDEPTFESLEQEYVYKKFIQSYTAVYVEEVTKAPVRLDFQEYGDSRNPYIVSLRFLGQDISKCLYQYVSNPQKMTREIGRELGFDEIEDNTWNDKTKGFKFSIPSHSFRYLKVNGCYVLDDNFKLSNISAGTLQECETAYKADKKKIEDVFLKQKSLIETRDFDAQKFYADLKNLQGKIRAIDYRKDSLFQYRAAINFTEELMDKLLNKTPNSTLTNKAV